MDSYIQAYLRKRHALLEDYDQRVYIKQHNPTYVFDNKLHSSEYILKSNKVILERIAETNPWLTRSIYRITELTYEVVNVQVLTYGTALLIAALFIPAVSRLFVYFKVNYYIKVFHITLYTALQDFVDRFIIPTVEVFLESFMPEVIFWLQRYKWGSRVIEFIHSLQKDLIMLKVIIIPEFLYLLSYLILLLLFWLVLDYFWYHALRM